MLAKSVPAESVSKTRLMCAVCVVSSQSRNSFSHILSLYSYMFSMADPLSVVASAVGIAAFAQQLAQSVLKIKAFCADVKNAPQELQDTLSQIENISNTMTRLSRGEAKPSCTTMNEDILDESLK